MLVVEQGNVAVVFIEDQEYLVKKFFAWVTLHAAIIQGKISVLGN